MKGKLKYLEDVFGLVVLAIVYYVLDFARLTKPVILTIAITFVWCVGFIICDIIDKMRKERA